jgi:hypothetical protein
MACRGVAAPALKITCSALGPCGLANMYGNAPSDHAKTDATKHPFHR